MRRRKGKRSRRSSRSSNSRGFLLRFVVAINHYLSRVLLLFYRRSKRNFQNAANLSRAELLAVGSH